MLRPLLIALLAASAAAAQTPPDAHRLALAAGYKAAFLCSDIFTAGRTEAQATADDLTGIYPEYESLVGGLPATIDTSAKSVLVAFDATLDRRRAVWRPLVGCTLLPVGAGRIPARNLPHPDLTPPELAFGDRRDWPLGDARAATPGSAALDRVVAAAFDHGRYGKGSETSAVIVLRAGSIVAERYRPDFDMHTAQRTFSVAKSLTATLVGRAVALGRIKAGDKAALPEWLAPGDPRATLDVETLLRMQSGLWTNGPGNRTDEIYLGGATVPHDAATRPLEAEPGSRWRYSNVDILLAAYALKLRLGDDALDFPFRTLLWPLGMTRTSPETDWQGNYILSSQVWMTARDLARLALLYERRGLAPDGKRLITEDWVRFVTTPAGAQPDTAAKGGRGYGAGFWLHGPGEGVPAGTYAMEGNRGQCAVIVPSARVIVIRRGFDAPGAPFDAMKFTADVLAALTTDRRTR